jgi:hypothetical protein
VAGAGSTPLHYVACGGNAVCCQVCDAISARGERPEDWVPPEDVSAVHYAKCDGIDETLPMGADGNDGIVDIFSAHSYYDAAGIVTPGFRRQTECEPCTCQDQLFTYTAVT